MKIENFLWEDQPRENGFFDFFLLGVNHLGNVLQVVTDRKLAVESTTTAGVVDCYIADVVSQSDYYPYGMIMSSDDAGTDYRYGFNGKEQDPEVAGNGNIYDYGFRIYNPRLGKFLSTDPLTASYPWYTPYQFAGNKPIWAIDLDGLEEWYTNDGTLSEITGPLDPSYAASLGLTRDIDLSPKVPWVSQFSLSNPNVACCRASQKILSDFGLQNSGSKANRIIVARNNSDGDALDVLKSAGAGVDYINSELATGNPVMVGVDHTISKTQSDGEAADHFVVIIGKHYDQDKQKTYYTFYEVGTKFEENGKSGDNRLYLEDDLTLRGTNYAGKRDFTVTDIRVNGTNSIANKSDEVVAPSSSSVGNNSEPVEFIERMPTKEIQKIQVNTNVPKIQQ